MILNPALFAEEQHYSRPSKYLHEPRDGGRAVPAKNLIEKPAHISGDPVHRLLSSRACRIEENAARSPDVVEKYVAYFLCFIICHA